MVTLEQARQILSEISTPEEYRTVKELVNCIEDLLRILDDLEIHHNQIDFIDFESPFVNAEGDEKSHYFAQLDEMTVELFSTLWDNNVDEAMSFFQSHIACFRYPLNSSTIVISIMGTFADPSLLQIVKEIIVNDLTSKGASDKTIKKVLVGTFEDDAIVDLWADTSSKDKEKLAIEIEFMRTLIDVAPGVTRMLEEYHDRENIFAKLTRSPYGQSGFENLTCEEFRNHESRIYLRRIAPAKIDFVVEQFLALSYSYEDIFTNDIIRQIAEGICEYLDDFNLAKWINEYPPLQKVVELVKLYRPLAYHNLLVYLMEYETDASERTLEILERDFEHGAGTQMLDVVNQQNDLMLRRLRNHDGFF